MDQEIENYLSEIIAYGIQEADSAEQKCMAKLVSPNSHFKEVLDLLKKTSSNYNIKDWPQERREKLYHLNNLWSEWQVVSRKHNSYSPELLLFANSLIRNLKNLKAKLNEQYFNEPKTKPDSSAHPSPDVSASTVPTPQQSQEPKTETDTEKEETYRWSSRHVDPAKVYGLDYLAMSMERQLVHRGGQERFKAVGIVGMAGIGKTALCQLVFNRPKVRQSFCPRIWVCMSKQPKDDPNNNGKEIVKRMLRCLGVEEEVIGYAESEERGIKGLIFALRLQLMGKKYLIVLDDAWSTEKFYDKLYLDPKENLGEQLAFGLPKGFGGIVVVTSRSEVRVKTMIDDEEKMRFVVPLSEPDDCWKIFIDAVENGMGKKFPEEYGDLKSEIVKRCARLPLSAKLMGQIFADRIRQEEEEEKKQTAANATMNEAEAENHREEGEENQNNTATVTDGHQEEEEENTATTTATKAMITTKPAKGSKTAKTRKATKTEIATAAASESHQDGDGDSQESQRPIE